MEKELAKKLLIPSGLIVVVALSIIIFSMAIIVKDAAKGKDESFIYGSSNDVITNVFIRNNTYQDYGLVGVESVSIVMSAPDRKTINNRKILKYDGFGNLIEEQDTVRDYAKTGNIWTLVSNRISHIEYSPAYTYIRATELYPYGNYDSQIYNRCVRYNDANYVVTAKVNKIDIDGVPIPDEPVASVVNRYKLTSNQ